MGRRGPAPTPPSLLVLRGEPHANRAGAGTSRGGATRGAKHAQELQPRMEPARPPRPKWLPERAWPFFDEAARELSAAGALARVDGQMLAMWAELMSRYVEAVLKIEETGPVLEHDRVRGKRGPKPTVKKVYDETPWLKVAKEAAEQADRLGRQFGLAPASRLRIPAFTPQSTKDKKREHWFQAS